MLLERLVLFIEGSCLKGEKVFRYARLLPVILSSGCASLQDLSYGMIEPDTYILVSVANCQTTQISVDYGADAGFADLKSYAWILEEHAGSTDTGTRASRQPHAWVADSVNAALAAKGFRLD